MKRGKPLRRTGFTPAQRATQLTRKALESKRPKMSPEERATRKVVRARSEGQCEIHLGHPASDMHHRLNRSQGGLWTPANILHICRESHSTIGSDPKAAAGQGWSIRNQRNPEDVPLWLAGRGWCFLHDNGHVTEAIEEQDVAS